MILDFFKILFKNNKKKEDFYNFPTPPVDTTDKTSVDAVYTPSKPPQNNKIKPKKTDIIDIKESIMAEIFLVVIDTNGRAEAKNFTPGIQNFYFIHANTDEDAKAIVLNTFRTKPHLQAQLQFSVKATRLNSIVKSMGQGSNFWTYIPFGNQRQPGQQGIPPSPDKLLRNDEYGQPSAKVYVPPAPAGGEVVTEEDLRGVQFNGADAKIMNKLRNPTGKEIQPLPEDAPPSTPEQDQLVKTNQELLEQNKALVEQMQKALQAISNMAPKPKRGKKQDAEQTPDQP